MSCGLARRLLRRGHTGETWFSPWERSAAKRQRRTCSDGARQELPEREVALRARARVLARGGCPHHQADADGEVRRDDRGPLPAGTERPPRGRAAPRDADASARNRQGREGRRVRRGRQGEGGPGG